MEKRKDRGRTNKTHRRARAPGGDREAKRAPTLDPLSLHLESEIFATSRNTRAYQMFVTSRD